MINRLHDDDSSNTHSLLRKLLSRALYEICQNMNGIGQLWGNEEARRWEEIPYVHAIIILGPRERLHSTSQSGERIAIVSLSLTLSHFGKEKPRFIECNGSFKHIMKIFN